MFWERHKPLVVIAGSVFALLLLEWLIFLRPYGAEAQALEEAYEETDKERDAYFMERGMPMKSLLGRFKRANDELAAAYGELRNDLHHEFEQPLIPAEQMNWRQTYVRRLHANLEEDLGRALSGRDVVLTTKATTFGFDLPASATEDLETDETWVRQMRTVRRFVEKVFLPAVKEEGGKEDVDGPANIVALESVEPLEPQTDARHSASSTEFGIELVFQSTLRGVMRILAACERPETFHTVKYLFVDGDSRHRLSQRYRLADTKTQQGREWHEHYYRVTLRVGTLVLSETPGRRPAPKPQQVARPPNDRVEVIKH